MSATAGLLAALAIGLMAPCIGMFLVLRHRAFLGDGFAHIALGGVALGLIASISTTTTALVAGIIAALGIGWVSGRTKLPSDTIIMVFFAGSLSLAAILLSFAPAVDLEGLLFGNASNVTAADLPLISGLAVIVLIVIAAVYRPLAFATFDSEAAQVGGVPVRALDYGLLVLTAVVVMSSIKITGLLLVASLITVPAATAIMLGRGFARTALLAGVISIAAVLGGTALSIATGIDSGGVIVLLSVIVFFVVLPFRRIAV